MYFVRYGIAVRYCGKETWDENELPEMTSVFDFDNRSVWPVAKLRSERASLQGAELVSMDRRCALDAELARRNHEESPITFDDVDELFDWLETFDDDEDVDTDHRTPILTGDMLTLPMRKMIRDLAAVERELESVHREVLSRKKTEAKVQDRLDKLETRAAKVASQLMVTDIGCMIADSDDPVEGLKNMAAQMLFLYAQARYSADVFGGRPDEDYYYAGQYLFSRAALYQMELEDRADWEEDGDPEDEEPSGQTGRLHQFPGVPGDQKK